MKITAKLTHPDRVDITMDITMEFHKWAEIRDILTQDKPAQRKPAYIQFADAISEMLARTAEIRDLAEHPQEQDNVGCFNAGEVDWQDVAKIPPGPPSQR